MNRVSVRDNTSFANDAVRQKNRLVKLYRSPYFGRVDFRFEGDEEETECYIGIFGFTSEIMEFSRGIVNNEKLHAVERHGSIPTLAGADSEETEILEILPLIDSFRKSAFSSLGILCKSQKDAREMHRLLQSRGVDCDLLRFESCCLKQGISVICVSMAKGLEFDQVIVPRVSQKNYHTVMDRNLLYIACTRALHRLDLTYSGQVCAFLR